MYKERQLDLLKEDTLQLLSANLKVIQEHEEIEIKPDIQQKVWIFKYIFMSSSKMLLNVLKLILKLQI